MMTMTTSADGRFVADGVVWVRPEVAAVLCGRSVATVLRACRSGHVRSRRLIGRVLIAEEDARRLAAEGTARGEPVQRNEQGR
jgi:hypothetical protein